MSSTMYLMRLELVAQDIDKGAGLAGVETQQWNKQLPLLQLTLKCLEENIQYSIRIQTESTWKRRREEEEGRRGGKVMGRRKRGEANMLLGKLYPHTYCLITSHMTDTNQ